MSDRKLSESFLVFKFLSNLVKYVSKSCACYFRYKLPFSFSDFDGSTHSLSNDPGTLLARNNTNVVLQDYY